MPRSRRLLLASQPLGEGVPRHVLDLVEGIAGSGWELEVACPRESSLWAALAERSDVRLHPISAARRPSVADFRSLAVLYRLAGQADVVHAHSSKAGFLARLAVRLRGRRDRCFFTPHGWSFWAAEGVEGALYLRLERLAARWCRTIVALSEHERDAGVAAGVGASERYRIVPNGINLDRFAAKPDPIPGRLVFVGRLAPPKRVDLVLHAFAGLRSRFGRAQLQVVGEGPLRPRLEELARELGVDDAVEFLGSRDDVPALLARAAVFVLASDYESSPLSVLEAQAAGVPVVATAVGGIPELVGDESGRLVPADDAGALEAAFVALLERPELARELGENGRRKARALWGRERMAASLVELYEEAL